MFDLGGYVELDNWSQIAQEEAFPGIVRQVFHGESTTVTRYTYYPGSTFPSHSHAEEQITMVHSGSIEFEIDGQKVTLGAGDVALIPGNAVHGATVSPDADGPVITDNYVASGKQRTISFKEGTER